MGNQSETPALPHWNLNSIYPGLDSQAFQDDFTAWREAIGDLKAYFDTHSIERTDQPIPTTNETIERLESVIRQINRVQQLGRKLFAYLAGFIATNSRNTDAQAWMSKLQIERVALDKLSPRFAAWVGALDLDAITAQSEIAHDHRYALDLAQVEAAHLMSPAEEDLAADMNLTGGSAWSKFYSNFSSQITAPIEIEGETKFLPMTALRNLAYDPNRDLRRRAFEVEIDAWEEHAMPIASALNSIKGQANTLYKRRGWDSPLDVALYNNHIDRLTLDAMLDTARDYFPHFRRYLRAKARVLSIDRCSWYDLFAPVGSFEREWTFEAARAFIVEQFGTFAPSMATLAQRAFDESWIDAEPRDGKRGGAFCMRVEKDISRVLANYQTSYGGVSTLAHELGHAYHNLNLAARTPLQRQTPMTLAETASTFCQIIVRNAALRDAPEMEQLAILEADLQDTTQVVVDITSRFLFEEKLFERRRERELSADELCEIMVHAQQETYGEGLNEEALHPYMWAVKPHYYSSVFYNFPYMFGLLFGLGLYAQYRQAPTGFVERYEDLLSSTGMANAADLATHFDIDITRPNFWHDSLSIIVEDIDRFEKLVDQIIHQ